MLDLTKLFNVSSYLYLTSFDIVNGDVCVSTALDIVLYIVIITSFGKSKISSLVVGGSPAGAYCTMICGADSSTATVAMIVKRVNTNKQNLGAKHT